MTSLSDLEIDTAAAPKPRIASTLNGKDVYDQRPSVSQSCRNLPANGAGALGSARKGDWGEGGLPRTITLDTTAGSSGNVRNWKLKLLLVTPTEIPTIYTLREVTIGGLTKGQALHMHDLATLGHQFHIVDATTWKDPSYWFASEVSDMARTMAQMRGCDKEESDIIAVFCYNQALRGGLRNSPGGIPVGVHCVCTCGDLMCCVHCRSDRADPRYKVVKRLLGPVRVDPMLQGEMEEVAIIGVVVLTSEMTHTFYDRPNTAPRDRTRLPLGHARKHPAPQAAVHAKCFPAKGKYQRFPAGNVDGPLLSKKKNGNADPREEEPWAEKGNRLLISGTQVRANLGERVVITDGLQDTSVDITNQCAKAGKKTTIALGRCDPNEYFFVIDLVELRPVEEQEAYLDMIEDEVRAQIKRVADAEAEEAAAQQQRIEERNDREDEDLALAVERSLKQEPSQQVGGVGDKGGEGTDQLGGEVGEEEEDEEDTALHPLLRPVYEVARALLSPPKRVQEVADGNPRQHKRSTGATSYP